ncbi:Imidazolonepropionase [Nonomuraea solani]|uniref:Imidazolonepropionase n=1 Tax=Nonomuraea solani TaxID=1144553 RepID=A0A1H6DJ16_9ACTN|nr:amidohydrolase family protein [Nonomuraea solani]SEG85202.1 Imidazolonepropionase [Nonomuraea solani]
MLLFENVRVFTGHTLLRSANVTIDDGVIVSVSEDATPEAAEVIDGRGRTLLPGLIDAHAHVFPGDLEQAALFGVTTVLDLMSDPVQAATLRTPSPYRADLRTAGTAATVPGGYGWYLVDMGLYPPFPTLTGPDDADAFAASRFAEGSDYLKIMLDDGTTTGIPTPSMADETAAALVAAARDRGRLAIAHTLTAAAARQALRAGVDVLGHVFVDRPDPSLAHELGDTAVIPTLTVLTALFGSSHAGGRLAGDPRVAPYLSESSRALLTMGSFPLPDGARHDLAVATRTVAELRDAGVTLLAGSDASNPGTAHGATLHHELTLLVAAGLTPSEALTAATAAPAARFALTDRGRIAPGLRADLLLVDGDPTANIDATLDIAGVWLAGHRLPRRTPQPPEEATSIPTPGIGHLQNLRSSSDVTFKAR